MGADSPRQSGVVRRLFHKMYCGTRGGVQKALHILIVLALISAELTPAAASAAPSHQEEPTPTPTTTSTETITPTATGTPSPTAAYTPTLTATHPYTLTITPTPIITPTTTTEPPPQPIPSDTPTPFPSPTVTASPSTTPEPPTVTPTISPTTTTSPTQTVTPTQGISLTLEVQSPNIKAGGVLRTAWQVEGWQAGMVLSLTVPVSFTLQTNPGGVFDPATGTLTIILTKDNGKAGWRIPDDLDGPYPITAALSLAGTLVATDSLALSETGLTHVPAGGGQAKGFKDKVRVLFPAGAAEESMKVYVHPPREDTTPPESLSSEPFEILARGKVSKQWLHQFNQPLTIELDWGAEQPAATLYSYDETTATWLPLPTEIDRQAGVLRATTTHLSVFDTDIENWQKAQMPDISAFQVAQFTGAAGYSYPIWTPPGPAGLQPSLNLSYNSQVVDASIAPMTQASWVGMGWSLDTGYILRQMHGTMDNLDDDTFLLVVGGVSSRLLKGSDGKYHLADENYWKVSYDAPTNTWTVWDKEGNRYIFGDSAGDRADYPAYNSNCSIPITQKTWKWMLSEARNKFNQAITYDYTKFQQNTEGPCMGGTHTTDMAIYPSTITYPNSQYSIVFTLQARSDIRNEWGYTYARTFYENKRLSYISVKRGSTTLRKYQFYYDDYIYPGYTWDQGGRTFELDRIQVTGVSAHGDLDNNLPEINFYYDGLHLTQATNGYGGSVTFSYESEPWYDVDNNSNYQYDYTDTCPNGWTGDISCPTPGTSKIGINGTGYHVFGAKAWQPGVAYHLSAQITNKSGSSQNITVKLQYGPNATSDTLLIGSSSTHCQNCTFTYENTVILPKNADRLRWQITCSSCWVLGAEATALPTRYRVTSRTVAESLTGQSNTFTYEYDDPGMNDSERSEAVASGLPLYDQIYDEYRGNAMVRETGPAGTDNQKRVTTTWFYQDDHRKGQSSGSLVSVNSPVDSDTFNTLDSNKWVFQSDIQSSERISGDKALRNPSYSTNWSSSVYRKSHSLTNNKAALVSFRMYGSNVETVLAAEHGDYGETGYRRWGIYVTTTGNVKVQYYVDASQPAPYEYSTGYIVSKNKWYTLLIFLDNSKLYLRLWDRSDPQSYFDHWIAGFTEPDGQIWRFHNWVNQSGGVFLDDYVEMKVYQLSFNNLTVSHNLYSPLPSPFNTYKDLEIAWTYQTSQQSWSYEGEGSPASGAATYSFYDTASQGGAQYGNLTHAVESFWDDATHAFSDYRVTWSRFYPNPTGNLVGLPGYTNQYGCPGGSVNGSCRNTFSSDNSNLLASHIYIYDNHGVTYSTSPSEGKLTNERTLLRFEGTNPKYADSAYHYDTWGNRDTVTVYTVEGTSGAFASSGAQTTTYCYGLYSGTTCNADSYHTYLGWEKNHLGHYTRYQYDYDFGLPRWMQAPNLAITEADFDNFGRLYKLAKPGDTLSDPTLKVEYDFDAVSYWKKKSQKLTPGVNSISVGYYNGLGQLVQAQTRGAEVNGQSKDIIVDSKYDPYGNLKSQSVPYEVTPSLVYHTPENQPDTLTTYDILGRPLTVKATDETTVIESYAYHVGNTVHTDAKGNQQTTNYDIQGRVLSIVPPTGPQVTYGYDKLDRLISATRGGATVNLYYDLAGRKIEMDDPDMGNNWLYTYDALGNLKTQTDARGCMITMNYDSLNRLTGKVYSGSCDSEIDVSYAYDSYTAFPEYTGSTAYATGQRTGMTDGSGKTMWTYDARGRLIREQKVINGSGTFVTQWGYNSADQVSSMTYPSGNAGQSGETVNYAYLPQMTLDTVSGSANYVSDTLYDAAGRVDLRKLGGTSGSPTLQTDFTYFGWTIANGWGRLKQVTSGTPANPTSLQDLRYYSGTDTSKYDANGNLLNIYDYKAGSPQTQTFTYDSLDRLLSAAASGGTGGIYSESYTYNVTTGNLASKGGVSYTYGAQSASCPDGALSKPHAVVTAGSNTYCYDKNGNQVKRTIGGSAYTLSYDAENRLSGVSGAATATFVYDGDGKRVKATAGGVTTVYVGDYYEWNGSTSTMVKYYYAGTTRIAMRTGSGTGTSGLNWLLSDHLGSTAITADASGNKVAELRYKAWGESRYTYGTTPTRRQYTGQVSEMATIGLYFYGARFYDPVLSRFTSADSIIPGAGQVQAWDRYAAMGNNPVKYVDPTGHAQVCADGDEGGRCGSGGNIPDKEKLEIIRKERDKFTNSLPSLSSWERPSWWDIDPQNPDYYTLAANFGIPTLPGVTATLTMDRYGGVYLGIGGNYGKSFEAWSINFNGGFVGSPFDDQIPDQANIQESFLKKLTINVSAGAVGGLGITWSPGAGEYIPAIAWEGGGYIPPNIGISAVYNWKIFDLAKVYGR